MNTLTIIVTYYNSEEYIQVAWKVLNNKELKI